MKYSVNEKKLIEKIEASIGDAAPGVCARAYHRGRLVCDVSVGQTYPYYDLASLTKIVFLVQAMMEAFDTGKWNLETKVSDVLPDYRHDTKISELLSHTSGLEWWKPFYETMPVDNSWKEKRPLIFEMINRSEINKTGKSVYSDLGIILAGFLIEKWYDCDLHEVWLKLKEKYYSSTGLEFHLENKTEVALSRFAPTEDCKWRKRILRGEVHDENTWSFGGISSHAGLFGSIEDMSAFGLNFRSQLQGIARYSIRQKTAQIFATRSVPVETGDWALGYMLPSLENASCGPHFSILSVGHTGFTGTSYWYDPRIDLMVILLSNRVHFGRENKLFAALRPRIHSWIFEML